MIASKIFIYGVPGVGKSTLSWHLKRLLNVPLVEGDQLRGVAQIEHSKADAPFLYLGTTEAWEKFGSMDDEKAVMQGIKAVRSALSPYVENEISLYNGAMIMEAAFLDPTVLSDRGLMVLVVNRDEAQHRAQYFYHRETDIPEKQAGFISVRALQQFLIQEAKHYPVRVVENEGDPGLVAAGLIKDLQLKP